MRTKRTRAANLATIYGTYLKAPGPTSTKPTQTFMSNMIRGYEKFGCKFLFLRREANLNTLNGLLSSGTNPQYTQLLQKVQELDQD